MWAFKNLELTLVWKGIISPINLAKGPHVISLVIIFDNIGMNEERKLGDGPSSEHSLVCQNSKCKINIFQRQKLSLGTRGGVGCF